MPPKRSRASRPKKVLRRRGSKSKKSKKKNLSQLNRVAVTRLYSRKGK